MNDNPLHSSLPYSQQFPYNPNPYQVHYPPQQNLAYRPPAKVNATLFMQSSKMAQDLLSDAQLVTNTFAQSKTFSEQLMSDAQQSKKAAVKELIRNTGIKTQPDISYTPEGLRLDFHKASGNSDCCHVIISLKWMNF